MINNLSTKLYLPVDNFTNARAKSAYGGAEKVLWGVGKGSMGCVFRTPSIYTKHFHENKKQIQTLFLGLLTRHRYKLKPMHFALGLDYLVARLERVFYWPVGQQLRTAGVQAYKNPLSPLKSQKTGQGGLL